MAQVTQDKCDMCGLRVDDRYEHIGWIQVNGSVTVSKGRDKNRYAKSKYLEQRVYDFCSAKCLSKRLDIRNAR